MLCIFQTHCFPLLHAVYFYPVQRSYSYRSVNSDSIQRTNVLVAFLLLFGECLLRIWHAIEHSFFPPTCSVHSRKSTMHGQRSEKLFVKVFHFRFVYNAHFKLPTRYSILPNAMNGWSFKWSRVRMENDNESCVKCSILNSRNAFAMENTIFFSLFVVVKWKAMSHTPDKIYIW